MSFFKNKHLKVPQVDASSEVAHTAEQGIKIVPGIGETAVEATLSPAERPKSFSEIVLERLDTVEEAQRALLRDAVDRGVPKADFPSLIADAINKGVLPR